MFLYNFQLGSVLSFYISGLILSYWPWPIVFYFWSGIALIWFIMFVGLKAIASKSVGVKKVYFLVDNLLQRSRSASIHFKGGT